MAQLKDTVVSGSLRATDTLYSTTAQFQILRAPTASNGTTYGPGTNGNFLKSNGTSIYWVSLAAADIPNISTDKLTSGTLPIGRGGTGQTTIANIQAGKDGNGNTISSTYLKLSGGTLTGILNITPATGEGGELHLNAATSEVTKNSIVLDNYYGAFRIFGGASADGTTKTGAGTPLVIDPYDKTITGGYTITGNLTGTASKATGDADGNTISSTYLKLSGGTLTGNLTISHATNATMTADSTNPKITFSESGSQPVHLIYTDYDNYRNPAGLKVIGGASANPAWFEVEGQIYTSGGTFKNIATSSNTSLYIQTNKNNGGVELRADEQGGNLKITGPDGTSYFEIDASNNTHLRVYSYSDFSNTSSTYKTINWDRTSGNLLNNDGTIFAGNTTLTKEIQLRARSAAGEIYLYTQGSATGSKGLYSYNASGVEKGILVINQSNQISSLADINTNINVVNGGVIIGTMADTVQRSINIRSKTGRVVLYTGVSYKGFYATSAPTTDAPDGIGKDIIRINNDNDVDSLAYFKVPVRIKSANDYDSTPSSSLTTELIQMYDSNLGIYHRIYSALGTEGSKTLFMMTREPGSELKTYVQFGVKLNSDGSPDFALSAKNNGTDTNAAARIAFRNTIGASSSGVWPVSLGGTGATDAANARTNLGTIAKTGDTMTGTLAIQNTGPVVQFNNSGVTTMTTSNNGVTTGVESRINFYNSDHSSWLGSIGQVYNTDGSMYGRIYVRNYKTDGSQVNNWIAVYSLKNGSQTYSVGNKANFRSAIDAVAKTGDTMSGGLIVSLAKGTEDHFVARATGYTNSAHLDVSLEVGNGKANHGIYSTGYSTDGTSFTSSGTWMIYRNNTGIITVNGNCTGTSANVTGTVAISNGGTGATTAAGARSSLAATQVIVLGDSITKMSNAYDILSARLVNGETAIVHLTTTALTTLAGTSLTCTKKIGLVTRSGNDYHFFTNNLPGYCTSFSITGWSAANTYTRGVVYTFKATNA